MIFTTSLQSQFKTVTLLFSALWLSSCVGYPVESYQTKVQKFKWGKMHVWMGRAHGTNTNYGDKEGYGHLLIDFTFKKNVLNEGCVITVSRAHLKNPNTGRVLLDTVSSISDSPPLSEKIEEYKTGQINLWKFPFEYKQSSFPYDLKIDMNFDCKGKQTSHTFAKQIKFRMVQPVAWEQ